MPTSGADGPPAPRLTVLDDVTWDGEPVPGERTHALLRSLAAAGARGLGESALVEQVWGDDVPANPTKALQVVVSRARSATGPDVIERTTRGYRLALGAGQVDAWALRPEALRLAAAGEYDAALPLLERADPDDEVVAALLRAVAGVHGVPAALDRYEAYRADIAERLGVDPSPELRTLHAELLARDRPVREGLLYESSPLIGREHDIAALEAMIRSSRIVSIVGAGGLGKTRLAHLMGRLAEQPVVHFVELAGVTSPDGVAVEVGDVLGVRESVAGRMTAAASRAGLVARIVDQVGTAPALLILDNCEHLVEAVADLVSVLVVRTPALRVLTTSRAPLGIAAERVYLLPQLGLDDAVALFVERASAARPGARLVPDEIRTLVSRLDGLPLAVELAAAKVRVMSVAEIERRLADRFALLRGGAREAPERHQTLIAVIDWSWNLLDDEQQAALCRLAVFRDGFSLAGADAVVDGEALVPLSALVEQSLVLVQERGDQLRYRMLETVREFGQLQLSEADDEDAARRRQRDWVTAFALEASDRLFGPDQVATMTDIRSEEGNLVDVLRGAVRAGDVEAVVVLMACLSDFWTIEGSHLKVVNLSREVEDVVVDAEVDPSLEGPLRATLVAIAFNTMIFTDSLGGRAFDRLEQVGWGNATTRSEVSARVLLTARQSITRQVADPLRTDGLGSLAGVESLAGLDELCADDNPAVARLAMLWSSQFHENQGDVRVARDRALQALDLTDDAWGPWTAALARAQLAGLTMQVGDMAEAIAYASDAIPVMEALGADEDAAQLKAVLAVGAMEDGRVADAERIFDEIEANEAGSGIFGAAIILLCGRAELDLAAGRVAEGLDRYRDAVTTLSSRSFPAFGSSLGYEPWVLYSESAAVAAHARHGHRPLAEGLRADLLRKGPDILGGTVGFLDYPIFGALLFALATWDLTAQADATRVRRAVRLLVYADCFGYNRQLPSLAWAPALALAEDLAPGESDRVRSEIGTRRAIELRDEVRQLLEGMD